jgi:hypothetical protein
MFQKWSTGHIQRFIDLSVTVSIRQIGRVLMKTQRQIMESKAVRKRTLQL